MARVFTVDEAAEYLHVTPYTIRKWLRKGKIPGRKIGRLYRIFQAELEAFLQQSEEAGEVPGPSPKVRAADVIGKFADVPFSSEDLLRERREEVERDERWWQEHFAT